MGEYEPEDSRNITGTASTPDGRWTSKDSRPPAGVPSDKPASATDATVEAGLPISDVKAHGEGPYDADGVLRPLHASIGVKDDVSEHEEDRVNPAPVSQGGAGTPGDKPSGPSNSA